jgi:hypothetical protein
MLSTPLKPSRARLTYDGNRIETVNTEREIQQNEIFSIEFPIAVHRDVLKYSLKFLPLEDSD